MPLAERSIAQPAGCVEPIGAVGGVVKRDQSGPVAGGVAVRRLRHRLFRAARRTARRGRYGVKLPGGPADPVFAVAGANDKSVLFPAGQVRSGVADNAAADVGIDEPFRPRYAVCGRLPGGPGVSPANAVAFRPGNCAPADDDFAGVGAIADGKVAGSRGLVLCRYGGRGYRGGNDAEQGSHNGQDAALAQNGQDGWYHKDRTP